MGDRHQEPPERIAARVLARQRCTDHGSPPCTQGACSFCLQHGTRAVEALAGAGLVVLTAHRAAQMLDASAPARSPPAGQNRMSWTRDMMDELRALWDAGLTVNQIAERMRISRNAIIGKAHRLKLAPRPSPIRRGGTPAPTKPHAIPPAGRHTLPPIAATPIETAAATPPPPPPPRRGSCMWPIGEPRQPGFRFCGDPLAQDTRLPYCSAHAKKARRVIASAPQDSTA